MSDYKITIGGMATSIIYTKDNKKTLSIYFDRYDPKPITYKDITMWEAPYEDEEITIEEKKEILENILKQLNSPYYKEDNIIKVDFSPENNIVHYGQIISTLTFISDILKGKEKEIGNCIIETVKEHTEWKQKKFKETSDRLKENLLGFFPYSFFKYCELPKDEYIKFKEEINKNKEIQYLLAEFAKWKVNEDKENINQKKFNYGLYALEILLCETTKEQVKEITKKYIEIAKEKNLSFEPFMKRNRELNKIINELQ